MKKKILAMFCSVCILAVNFVALSNVTVFADTAGSTTILEWDYITGAKSGNIFAITDDPITFTQRITNKTSEVILSRYTWNITDEAGGFVASYTHTDQLASKQSKTRGIAIANPGKYGIYTINVTEENCTKAAQGTKYSDTYTEEFSVCISLDSSNVDQNFGFNQAMVRLGMADYQTATPLMVNAGAKWHRETITWSANEKSKGVYKELDSSKVKLESMKESGIETVCVIAGCNKLYDDEHAPSSPEGITAFANFCAHVAEELDGLVDHFEIWNEWNHVNFNPTRETPETYAEVLKAAYTAIKAVDSDITVIGLNTAGISSSPPGTSPLDWMERVLIALDGGTYMDAVGVHCYDYSATEGFPEEQFIEEVAGLKALLQTYNVNVPIWLTETGFSTYDNSTAGFVPGCTKDVQLNSMVMLRAINKAYGLFDKVIQYCLYDYGDQTDVESNWGILNCWERDHTERPEAKLLPNGAKPAYLGTAAMNYFVGGNTVYQDMLQDGRSYAFKFYNSNLGKNVVLAINGGLNNTLTQTLQLGCSSIEIYDKYGNLTREMNSLEGVYSIDTFSDPIYIVGNFTDFDVYYPDMSLKAAIDLNTLEVTISGKTQIPNDIVSVMVVTKGAELASYNASRVKYIGQTVSDANGDFSVQYVTDTTAGTYQIYVNSERQRSRVVEDMEFIYTVPELSVLKNSRPVTSISQLTAGDRPVIKLTGIDSTGITAPKVIVAQYEGETLKNVRLLNAAGDYTTLGSEFSDSFTVLEDVDRIKVMYWRMDSHTPLVAFYEIN